MNGSDGARVREERAFYEELEELAARLAQTDLRPSPPVNGLFRRLVKRCLNAREHEMTAAVRSLRPRIAPLCAEGESRLERYWAELVVEDSSRLGEFPFLAEYRRLVARECSAVDRHHETHGRRWVWVGSGPLPLSALLALGGTDLEVTLVDHDPGALRWSRDVVRAVEPSLNARFVCASAASMNYRPFDVVVVAALAGHTLTCKAEIMDAIAASARTSALVLARSVPRGGCELLYPRIERVSGPWGVVDEIQPARGVINSTLVLKRFPRCGR